MGRLRAYRYPSRRANPTASGTPHALSDDEEKFSGLSWHLEAIL